MSIVSIEKETGKNIINLDIHESPFDLLYAYNFALYVLRVREHLPDKYMPEDWQWFFDEEVEKLIRKYKDSLKVDKVEDERPKYNILADEILGKIRGENG